MARTIQSTNRDFYLRSKEMLEEFSRECYHIGGPFFFWTQKNQGVQLEIQVNVEGFNIHFIRAIIKGQKLGRKALLRLGELADKYQVPLRLEIKEMDNKELLTPKKVLRRIYEEVGFVKDKSKYSSPNDMIRLPLRAKS